MPGSITDSIISVVMRELNKPSFFRVIFRYNLGAFYFGTNHFAKARYQFEEAYQVLQAFLGDDHPDTVAAKQAWDSVKE